jgi:release factor glutamine methyltransferase
MEKKDVQTLLAFIKKKLLTKFPDDQTMCTQYAWWLIEAITGKKEIELISQKEINWHEKNQQKLDDALHKLINKDMPLQYILGVWPFGDLEIKVKPPVLIPRPETEEWTLNLINQLKPCTDQKLTILDLCTGSGCIALALAKALPKAFVYGTDISDHALMLAKQNAQHNHIKNVEFLYSDLFNQIPKEFKFDLIVGNPPYIAPKEWSTLEKSVTEWEDKQALVAPDNGLAVIKKIIDGAPRYIKPNDILKKHAVAQLVLEIDIDQASVIVEYMKQHNYTHINVYKDLEGKDRVVAGRVDDVAITAQSQ